MPVSCRWLAALLVLSLAVLPAAAQAANAAPAPAPAPSVPPPPPPPPLPALTVHGEDFVDAAGKPVRFWGVNLASLYVDHAVADAIAATLAQEQVNLVRPHHNLRPSLDTNPRMISGSLLTYKGNSRTLDPDALDRFDYLNAALKRKGIYLALSANWTRRYLPDDADIQPGDPADRAAWAAAMKELNGLPWQRSFDLYKMLPCLDDRAELLNEEFVKKFLAHVNPYTGVAYGADPQVLTYEVLNEASFDYDIVCQAKFPAYWQQKLEEKWKAYAAQAGVDPGADFYKPAGPAVIEARARFLRKLDDDYFQKMKAVIRAAGCGAAITFSNLWRGDNALALETGADHIENHMYMDPLVAAAPKDGFIDLTQTALAGKPFFIGELNEGEGDVKAKEQGPSRSMLPLATAAYASLQNWTGVVWFAWTHGAPTIGADGWSLAEGRGPSLGRMVDDGMMIDHLRTCGIIFRRGLVAKSREPKTLYLDEPAWAAGYSQLMTAKNLYQPGWQGVYEMRRAFGPVPEGQAAAPWMTQAPPNPIVSDTQQIVKDTARRQLTVAAPQVEAFSGFLDAQVPAGLRHLALEGADGFATVVVVADDGQNLDASMRLILSRTGLDAAHLDSARPRVRLRGLKKPAAGEHWSFTLTRPRDGAKLLSDFTGRSALPLTPEADGSLLLPAADWHEGELALRP